MDTEQAGEGGAAATKEAGAAAVVSPPREHGGLAQVAMGAAFPAKDKRRAWAEQVAALVGAHAV